MVLPCEDNLLRKITQERPSYRVSRYDFLPRDIENALASVIEKEIDLQRRLDLLKGDLDIRYDYSTYAAFKSVDKYSEGFINTYNLGLFLKNNGYYANEREILAIIRRIDTDGDAKLSYSEFSDFLNSVQSRAVVEERRSASQERGNRSFYESRHGSPLKNQSTYQSPARSHSAYGRRASTPLRDSLHESRISPLKESLAVIRGSPVRKQPLLRLEDEDELVRSLREQISLEKEIENAKISLVQRPDFNLFDAFRIFDIDAKGYINFIDLKEGLNAIGIFPATEELDLYIKRYDKNSDKRIRFSEFSDSFTPLDGYYGSLVNRRTSNDVRGRLY
jgi:Ca2+-binding EF-hand superfamily protein